MHKVQKARLRYCRAEVYDILMIATGLILKIFLAICCPNVI